MLKLSAVSAAFFAIAASGASACVGYDGPSDTFTSTCENEVFIQYRTVGGGCYATDLGAFSLKPGASKADPLLSEACGSTTNWRVDWAWCDQADFDAGTCKPKF